MSGGREPEYVRRFDSRSLDRFANHNRRCESKYQGALRACITPGWRDAIVAEAVSDGLGAGK
jgi:hypothetical protein